MQEREDLWKARDQASQLKYSRKEFEDGAVVSVSRLSSFLNWTLTP
jgi:hypothetical protein